VVSPLAGKPPIEGNDLFTVVGVRENNPQMQTMLEYMQGDESFEKRTVGSQGMIVRAGGLGILYRYDPVGDGEHGVYTQLTLDAAPPEKDGFKGTLPLGLQHDDNYRSARKALKRSDLVTFVDDEHDSMLKVYVKQGPNEFQVEVRFGNGPFDEDDSIAKVTIHLHS